MDRGAKDVFRIGGAHAHYLVQPIHRGPSVSFSTMACFFQKCFCFVDIGGFCALNIFGISLYNIFYIQMYIIYELYNTHFICIDVTVKHLLHWLCAIHLLSWNICILHPFQASASAIRSEHPSQIRFITSKKHWGFPEACCFIRSGHLYWLIGGTNRKYSCYFLLFNTINLILLVTGSAGHGGLRGAGYVRPGKLGHGAL